MARKLANFIAMSTNVNIAEFKDRISEFLALVEKGGEVIVCRRNVPVARVESVRQTHRAKPEHGALGCMKGSVKIHGNLTEPCISEGDWDMLH